MLGQGWELDHSQVDGYGIAVSSAEYRVIVLLDRVRPEVRGECLGALLVGEQLSAGDVERREVELVATKLDDVPFVLPFQLQPVVDAEVIRMFMHDVLGGVATLDGVVIDVIPVCSVPDHVVLEHWHGGGDYFTCGVAHILRFSLVRRFVSLFSEIVAVKGPFVSHEE